MPIFSEPAIGCDPTKRAPNAPTDSEHRRQILPLTLPTSVTSEPSLRLGAIFAASSGMFSVGTHITVRSASSAASSGSERTVSKILGRREHFSRVDSLLDHADILPHRPQLFAANANEAPRSPAPSIAILRNFIFPKLNPRAPRSTK